MLTLYIACAAVGCSLLVMQFVFALIGMGGHAGLDTGHGGLDTGHGDFHAGDHGDAAQDHADAQQDHADSSWFFKILSVRSAIAAIAFFGLGGGLGTSMGLPGALALVIAITVAVCAMVLVAWLMHLLIVMREEGTTYIQETLGCTADVYLNIPAKRSGAGKITVAVKNGSMEYVAVTDGDALATGSQVVIDGIENEHTVLVRAKNN